MVDYSEGRAIHGHMDFAPDAEARTGGEGDALRSITQLTRSTVAMILAGGRGARLGPLTDWRAKPAVPFGGKFRIIDFALSNCVNSGVRRIGVLTQYKAQSLIRHVQRGWGFLDGRLERVRRADAGAAARVDRVVPGHGRRGVPEPRHPASATSRDYVLVLAGDHVYKMDYSKHPRRSRRAAAPT